MMTKNKSRFTAKLKALFIIPVAIITFFVFADMTVKSPIMDLSNYSTVKVSNLNGLWLNANNNSFGKLILLNDNKLSVLESIDKVEVRELNVNITDKGFEIKRYGPNTELIKYELSGSQMKIWWADSEYSIYTKTSFKNSFDALKQKQFKNIELPVMSETRILDKPHLVYNIYVLDNKYYVDDKACTLKTLKSTLENRVKQFNKLDRPFITARLVTDKNAAMKPIYNLYQVMRELRLYKMAYATLPSGNASALQYHSAGILQLLPPSEKDGAKLLDTDEVGDDLIVLEPTNQIEKIGTNFSSFIQSHPKYVASYQWNNATTYQNYVAIMNMSYKVIFSLRDEYTLEKYNLAYADLPSNLQKEARKKYRGH